MKLDNVKKIELEITSNCNAACPGCARTQNLDLVEIDSVTIEDIERLFPSEEYIRDKNFKFCGVLGDPIVNKDCLEIVRYLVANGGFCQLSTNAGLRDAEFWRDLGRLSRYTGLVDINFCIDGHKETNHIYRVNTNFDVIERNLAAYTEGAEGSPMGTWIYIVFDHNEHELEIAESHAKSLGLQFATRTGMRNSLHTWVADIKRRDEKTKKMTKEQTAITTTGDKEHSKKKIVEELDQFIKLSQQKKTKKTPPPGVIMMMSEDDAYEVQKQQVIDSIKCKMVHEDEIFIASNMTLWPCCFLWDSAFKNKENINEKLGIFDEGWNDLRKHSIEEIMSHPWFEKILVDSWDPDHPLHFDRCIRTCAYNKAYQNEIKIK
jgi:MoaA/NifB/PqqE/SkfB family radical SAM enzyme